MHPARPEAPGSTRRTAHRFWKNATFSCLYVPPGCDSIQEDFGAGSEASVENLGAILEAILFVSGDPVRTDALAHSMNLTVSELEEALSALADHLALENRGIQLNRSGGTVFLSIRPQYARQVEAFLQPLQKQPLSQAVLETLSIIAYRQPVTKGDIEAVRGVKCDYSVQSLLNKGFIEECGRRETLGRPILYATTDKFLQHFGMETLADLPSVDLSAPEGEIGV